MVKAERPTVENVRALVENLREHDAFEFSLIDETPEEAIWKTLNLSAVSAMITVDGVPACLWGVRQETIMGGGHIWFVTTPLIYQYKIKFLREGRKIVQRALEDFNYLYGFVDCQFEKSCRWMEWLGFENVAFQDLGDIKLYRYELRGG